MKKLLFSLLSIFPSRIALMLLLIALTGTSCQKTAVSEQKPVTANNVDEVKIGSQRWMAANLNVSRYRNGDVIPHVTDQAKWANLTTGAWCYYNNDPANGAVYGKLYNWYAVHDPRGLAPIGWHIPSDSEWTVLSLRLGSNAGGKLKETGITHWMFPNTAATNSSGFTGLPGGLRDYVGAFNSVGYYGHWWVSTETDADFARECFLSYNDGLQRGSHDLKQFGFSVRCIKD